MPPERDPKQRNPWALTAWQSQFLPCTSSPCGVQAAADPMVLSGSGGFCPSLGPSVVSGQAGDSSLIFKQALLLSLDDWASLSSSCNWVLGAFLPWAWQGFSESSWYSAGKFTTHSLRLQWSWLLRLSKLYKHISLYIWVVYHYMKQQIFLHFD